MMHTTSADDRGDDPPDQSLEVSAHLTGWDFESLYAAKYSDMVRLAYFLTGSMAQAEEATQDSFVRLYERWSKVGNHLELCKNSTLLVLFLSCLESIGKR